MDIRDFELVELFNWQEEVRGMISQMEFVRMVDVQSETIERYIRESKDHPGPGRYQWDRTEPLNILKKKMYMTMQKFGWELITPANMKDKFMDMVVRMDMSYSYKPVLLKEFSNIWITRVE